MLNKTGKRLRRIDYLTPSGCCPSCQEFLDPDDGSFDDCMCTDDDIAIYGCAKRSLTRESLKHLRFAHTVVPSSRLDLIMEALEEYYPVVGFRGYDYTIHFTKSERGKKTGGIVGISEPSKLCKNLDEALNYSVVKAYSAAASKQCLPTLRNILDNLSLSAKGGA